jgi:hypothetical protein
LTGSGAKDIVVPDAEVVKAIREEPIIIDGVKNATMMKVCSPIPYFME